MIMDCDILIFISIYSNLFYDSLNVQDCGKINNLIEIRHYWLWTIPYYVRSQQITSYSRSKCCLRLQVQHVISDDTWKDISGYWLSLRSGCRLEQVISGQCIGRLSSGWSKYIKYVWSNSVNSENNYTEPKTRKATAILFCALLY